MKKLMFLMATAVMVAMVSCGTQKQVAYQPAPQQPAPSNPLGTEVSVPCVDESYDDDDNFRALGTATHVNMQSARSSAFDAAQSMIYKRLGGFVEGLSTDYSRTVAGQAAQDKVQRLMEGEMDKIVQKMVNDARKRCEKMYTCNDGAYKSFIAIEIPKKELINNMANTLSHNEELEIEFNRDQFRKFAEERMAKMKENQKNQNQ